MGVIIDYSMLMQPFIDKTFWPSQLGTEWDPISLCKVYQ